MTKIIFLSVILILVVLLTSAPFFVRTLNSDLENFLVGAISALVFIGGTGLVLLALDLPDTKWIVLSFLAPAILFATTWTSDKIWPSQGSFINFPRTIVFMLPGLSLKNLSGSYWAKKNEIEFDVLKKQTYASLENRSMRELIGRFKFNFESVGFDEFENVVLRFQEHDTGAVKILILSPDLKPRSVVSNIERGTYKLGFKDSWLIDSGRLFRVDLHPSNGLCLFSTDLSQVSDKRSQCPQELVGYTRKLISENAGDLRFGISYLLKHPENDLVKSGTIDRQGRFTAGFSFLVDSEKYQLAPNWQRLDTDRYILTFANHDNRPSDIPSSDAILFNRGKVLHNIKGFWASPYSRYLGTPDGGFVQITTLMGNDNLVFFGADGKKQAATGEKVITAINGLYTEFASKHPGSTLNAEPIRLKDGRIALIIHSYFDEVRAFILSENLDDIHEVQIFSKNDRPAAN